MYITSMVNRVLYLDCPFCMCRATRLCVISQHRIFICFLQVNVSEQFQRKASYKPLGMFFKAKTKAALMDEVKDLGLCSLFKPQTGSDSTADGQGETADNDSKDGQAIGIQIGTLGIPGNSSLQRSQSETDSPMKCV